MVPAEHVVHLDLSVERELLPGVLLRYDDGSLVLDRTAACPPGGAPVVRAPLASPEDGVQVVTDTCSVEIFADGGRVAMTALAFPVKQS